jgi:hypothetical protein
VEITSIFPNKWKNIDGRRERHLLFFGGQKSPLTTICFIFCDFYHLSSIYSDELVIFLFFCSKDVDARAFLCWCSYAPYYRICDALFLLISLTDSGTQLVNNKDRRQKLIYVKLIYYKYPIINHKKLQWNVRMVPLHQHDVFVSCNTVFLRISTPSVNNKDRRQKLIHEKLIYYKYSII